MQVKEARAASEKAQKLQENVANRKRNRQLETGGLVITRALYGNEIVLNNLKSSSEISFESTSDVIDVTIPLNFLVNDSGELKVCFLFMVQVLTIILLIVRSNKFLFLPTYPYEFKFAVNMG